MTDINKNIYQPDENIDDNGKKSFSIYGCCVSRDIFNYGTDLAIDRYVGFVNPVPAVSDRKSEPLSEEQIRQIYETNFSKSNNNFRKRNLILEYNKTVFDYFDIESDYMVLDLADLRLLLMYLDNGNVLSRSDMIKSKEIMDNLKIINSVRCVDLPWETITDSLDKYCTEIIKRFPVSKIIIHEALPVFSYIDNEKMYQKFGPLWDFGNIKKLHDFLIKCYKYIEDKFKGCHIISMPENMHGLQNHKWGHSPLHYTNIYYEYAYKAIKIISQSHDNEELLLENLRMQYSIIGKNEEIDAKYNKECTYLKNQLTNATAVLTKILADRKENSAVEILLKNETDVYQYLRKLALVKNNYCIILTVKGTAGNTWTDEIENELRNGLGFSKISKNYGLMYIGICMNGKISADIAAEKSGQALVLNEQYEDITLHLESRPFKDGNVSITEINGKNYSTNVRGVNITVYDPIKKEAVDSVGFDHQDHPRKLVRLS